jgi:hypothetical protein
MSCNDKLYAWIDSFDAIFNINHKKEDYEKNKDLKLDTDILNKFKNIIDDF